MKRYGFAALVLAACASSTPAPARRAASLPPEDQLLLFAPSGAYVLVDVDMARLRNAQVVQKLVAALPANARPELKSAFGFDLYDDVDRQLYWFRKTQGTTDYVMVSRGRFDRTRVATARGGTPASYRGAPFFQARDSAGAFVADDVFALGTVVGVQTSVDVAQSAAPALGPDEPAVRLRASAGATDRTAVRLAALIPRDVERMPRLVSLLVRLDLGGGALDISFTGEHENPAAAIEGEKQLRQLVSDARPYLAALGMGSYLDGVVVAAQGNRVLATVHLSDKQCDQLATFVAQYLPELMKNAGSFSPQDGRP